MIKTFNELLDVIKSKPKKTIAVAMAEEYHVLSALSNAFDHGIADAVLVGNKKKILEISKQHNIDIQNFDIVNTTSEDQSVVRAVQLVRERLADTLMKGKCSSANLLRGVLNKQKGVRTDQLLSHVAAFEIANYPKLLLMSDGGMNILPDLQQKVGIINNAILAAKHLQIENPKVALIAAIEKVNHGPMPCTSDAAILSKMGDRGQIQGAIIDGPLALDNAISKKACEVKGINSPINGEADILIMPNIETGNVFYKAITYLGYAKSAGVILGAKVPIILTSRADSEESKFMSIAFGMLTSERLS